jgi:hypothetical protein
MEMMITKPDEASGARRQGEASTSREGNREEKRREEKRKEWKLSEEIARRWSAVAKHGGSSMAAVADRITGAVSIATEKEKNVAERLARGERGGSAWREREATWWTNMDNQP